MKDKVIFMAVSIGILCFLIMSISFHNPAQLYQTENELKDNTFQVHDASDPSAFISLWDTRNAYSMGSSGYNQVHLPLEMNGTYDFFVDWGDGSNDSITEWDQAQVTHTYSSPGVVSINITGLIVGWRFNYGGDKLKIIEIQQWGCLRLGNSGNYFHGCFYLRITATDISNLTGTTNLAWCFAECRNLDTGGNLNEWNVSNIINMEGMFFNAHYFNQFLGAWNVSNVIDMSSMFSHSPFFNQPLNNWNVSRVIDMDLMFYSTGFFNQPLDLWNVSHVKTMRNMFCEAGMFNQSLNNWDTSHVSDMTGMFDYAINFNQSLDTWNVSRVINMSYMFCNALSFNQALNTWNVTRVTNMESMFAGAVVFNQPLDMWNVSRVNDMNCMFFGARHFDQPIGNWDVSNVMNMDNMFYAKILSTSNYDNLLLGWSKLPLQTGVSFYARNSKYSIAARNAREYIISHFHWSIIDGGMISDPFDNPNIFTQILFISVIIAVISIPVSMLSIKGIKKKMIQIREEKQQRISKLHCPYCGRPLKEGICEYCGYIDHDTAHLDYDN